MKKGITIVFIANIVNMFFSVITSFIMPKYLSIESYGYFKVFQLYVNYLGIAHLGFVDGIYLKYGGQSIKRINAEEILKSSSTLRNMQIIIMILGVGISIVLKNPIFLLLSLSCVPVNMVAFYKNLYQATGEFKDYGLTLSILPIIMFVLNVILLLVVKTDNYIAYILVVFLSNLLLYLILELKSRKLFGKISIGSFDLKILKDNIFTGITLTIGNFASIMITSIDRWLIQAWMTISDFSFYSFAVSVENLFNVCVSAVTTTLYNYLCRVTDVSKIVVLKTYCTIVGIYLVAVAFPAKFIIQIWLEKYNESIDCLFILICAYLFYFVIRSVYVNLYKARGQQRHYLYQMIIILIIAAVTNFIGYNVILKAKEVFAWATLITAMIWYFICYYEFKDIRGKFRENILLLFSAILYLVMGLLIKNAIIGCALYFTGATILISIFLKKDFFKLLHLLGDNIKINVNKIR